MPRKLIVQLPGGIATPIDINKKGSFFDLDIDDRQDVIALRLVVGRETVTISRKDEDTDEYSEGFFYHLMSRDRPALQREDGGGIKSPIQTDTIGFCYQSDGQAVEFTFDYSNIMQQLRKRDRMVADLKNTIAHEFDSDNLIELEGKLNRLINAPLNFNIARNKDEYANLIERGIPIHLYYKMTEEEELEFSTDLKKYRIALQEEQNTQTGKALEVDPPLIPRLTETGKPPSVQFTVRASGQV